MLQPSSPHASAPLPAAAPDSGTCTAFLGTRRIASGRAADLAAQLALVAPSYTLQDQMLVFDDDNGQQVDLPPPGMPIPAQPVQPAAEPPARPRGRPRLGVVAREVTLLPDQWDWLSRQPGGASATLRRLVLDARRAEGGRSRVRTAQEAAYRFMTAIAGNLPGFEEALRALFAQDQPRFDLLTRAWPEDVHRYAHKLAADAWEPA
ncbi:DUF2239 family protein [Xylophilus sp. GW821-FHT01B05]